MQPSVPEEKNFSAMLPDLSCLPLGRIMGIDYGDRRIGIAFSDPSQMIATPHCTLDHRGEEEVLLRLQEIIHQWSVVVVVVGWPVHMNGSEGERTAVVQRFIETFSNRFHLPVFSWDERWTTVSAAKSLLSRGESPSKNKSKIDAIAAAFIIQSFLDRLHYLRKTEINR